MRTGDAPARWLILSTVLAVAGGVASLRAQATAPVFTNVTVHDPSIVREGGTFYVFGSHLASASSTDLMRWTQISTTPTVNNPLAPNPQQEFSEAITWVGAGNAFWAPDVIKLPEGRFAYYYCIGRLDQPRAALGLAFANSITGPYSHETLLLRSGPGGQPPEAGPTYDATIHPNTVDPALFYDQAGQLWMVYGSYSGGIFILRMDATTGRPVAGQGYGKKLIGGNHARIEGAYILYSPETDYYYMFVSFGGLDVDGGYNIRLGRSRQPDGPYVDAAGKDLATVAGAPGSLFDDASIAPHGVKLMGGYQFLAVTGEPRTQSRGYVSPGHNSAYRDPATGKYFNIFHTRFVDRGGEHEVRVHQMFLNADGWLVVAPHRYAGETIAPTSPGQISGQYKYINHGKAISATVTNSTLITLNADGSVSGSATGTWQLAGDYQATLVLSGTTYRGVFLRQWDDDQQVWVRTFTALSGDGVAIWGSKVASTVTEDPPTISLHPWSVEALAGSTVTLNVSAHDAATYQWRKDNAIIADGTRPMLVLNDVSAADAATYRVVVSNAEGSVTSDPAIVVVRSGTDSRIKNLSVRANLAATQTLIVGFNAAGEKEMLVRGVGPTLSSFGLTGVHPNPEIDLYDTTRTRVDGNDDWPLELAPVFNANGAFALVAGSLDAALLRLVHGAHSAHIRGPQSGVVLVEVYDSGGPGRLNNVSARNQVGVGADVLIAGLVVTGGVARTLLVRAVGPKLAEFGIPGFLADPKLEIYRSVTPEQSVLIAENDNWDAALIDLAARAGAAGLPLTVGSRDAAVVITVPPGAYSAVVSGVNQTTGEALVEVYELP